MKNFRRSTLHSLPRLCWASASLALFPLSSARAADHGDAPAVNQDSGADLADAFLFLDPNDNTRVIIAMTVHGFIVPGEALNFATFDPKIQYVFEIENTGDAKVDKKIRVTFDKKVDSASPQMAHIKGGGMNFFAPATAATLAATPLPQTVTTDPKTARRSSPAPWTIRSSRRGGVQPLLRLGARRSA